MNFKLLKKYKRFNFKFFSILFLSLIAHSEFLYANELYQGCLKSNPSKYKYKGKYTYPFSSEIIFESKNKYFCDFFSNEYDISYKKIGCENGMTLEVLNPQTRIYSGFLQSSAEDTSGRLLTDLIKVRYENRDYIAAAIDYSNKKNYKLVCKKDKEIISHQIKYKFIKFNKEFKITHNSERVINPY